MPGRADIFAQLSALDIPDAGSILPEVDLARIGLVYLLKSAEDRGLPTPTVLRFGSCSVSAVVGEYSGLRLTAGRRCLRLESWKSDDGNVEAVMRIHADQVAFTTLVDADTDFSRIEPDDLVGVSLMEAGRTTANPVPTGTNAFNIDNANNDNRQVLNLPVDIPPGFVLEFWNEFSNSNLALSFWAREIGP